MREKLLVLLLRVAGAATLTAFGAMFLPTAWMQATHAWLGLGKFPASSLVDYLTRSVAALYGFHGGVLVLLSTDVRRYRPLVVYAGWMHVLFGAMMVGVGRHAGLPGWWVAVEGPPVLAGGVALLWLLRGVPQREPS